MKKRDILFLSSSAQRDLTDILSGIVPTVDRNGWSVHVVGDIHSRKRLINLLKFWSPDGCIVHSGFNDGGIVPGDFGRIPVVWIDRDPATLPPSALCVIQDSRPAGTLAAKELLRYDLELYAFVDRADPQFWSKGRREAFRESVELNGKAYREFTEPDKSKWSRALKQFLLSLPRPCGLFCTNDTVAVEVMSQAAKLGIEIPEDMLVAGVDDVDAFCEAVSPTLTSVRPSFAAAGLAAAELLARRIANPRLKGVIKTFEAKEMTRRQSTRRITTRGGNIGLALEMIRRRAADGVTVCEVVKLMKCSRRSAEIRFKQYLHSSILDEIHSARIELAKKLISDGDGQIGGLHLRCGFSSPATFRRVFKSFTGVSPQVYRQKSATSFSER